MYPIFTRKQIEQRRQEAALLFAQNLSNAEVARRIGVSRPTVSGWRQRWQADQKNGLALRAPGPASRLSRSQQQQLADALLPGPQAHGYDTQLWTLARIAEVIERRFGVTYNPHYVSELLHKMGWSCQKPLCRARERNEDAIARWVAEEWPQIKKGHKSERPL
jgi:putative transposase